MKKKRLLYVSTGIAVLLLCTLLCVIYYRYLLKKPYIYMKDIDRITITLLPPPPKTKTFLDKDDIEKFIDIIEHYSYKPVIRNFGKGWDIKVDIFGSPDFTIIFGENYMELNGTWYISGKEIKEDIRQLFQNVE